MIVETVRVTERGKQQLIQLKRKTGIENWNVLCRWALVYSLADPTIPPREEFDSFSNIEIGWRTFGGKQADLYEAIFRQRAKSDKVDDSELHLWFVIHLHRGISFMTNSTSGLRNLFERNAVQ